MNQVTTQTRQPYMIIGAGDLVSHVHRVEHANSSKTFHFNLFRSSEGGTVDQSFRPSDLRDFVKACQVLAFEMASGGWLSGDLRDELIQLSTDLDEITFRWSDRDE